MSVVARAIVTNRQSASVHELAGTGGTGPRTDDWGLLERLEAENLELRNRAIQLELQIQTLRHVGGSEVGSARGRMRQ
jgi:hypothetical protein